MTVTVVDVIDELHRAVSVGDGDSDELHRAVSVGDGDSAGCH